MMVTWFDAAGKACNIYLELVEPWWRSRDLYCTGILEERSKVAGTKPLCRRHLSLPKSVQMTAELKQFNFAECKNHLPIYFIAISGEIDRDNVVGKTICNISRWTTFSTFPETISWNVIKGYLPGPHCEQLRFNLFPSLKQFLHWRDIIWFWTKLVLDLMALHTVLFSLY